MQGQIEIAESSIIGSIVIYSVPVWPTHFSHMVAFSAHKRYCAASWNLLLDGRLRQSEPRLRLFCYKNHCLSDDGLIHISDPAYNHIVYVAGVRVPGEEPTP